MSTIRKGDLLRLAPQWLGPGEDPQALYVAASDEERGSVDISPVEWEFRIVPIETVKATMVVKVEGPSRDR